MTLSKNRKSISVLAGTAALATALTTVSVAPPASADDAARLRTAQTLIKTATEAPYGAFSGHVSRAAVADLIQRAQAAGDDSYVTELIKLLKLLDDSARAVIPAELRQAVIVAGLKYGGPALAEFIDLLPVALAGLGIPQDVAQQITGPIAAYIKAESGALAGYLATQPKGPWKADAIAAFLHDQRGVPYSAAVVIAGVLTFLGN